MPETFLKIPQIGEGLQEARVVALLKQPGDWVKRDEAIYQMETDKAVMDVESPVEGRLVRWLAKPDDVLGIGADVLVLETLGGEPAAPVEGMVDLVVPQIGEGLQEARIVAFLKQPGEAVARDEPVYQMETDKAVMDVESPFSGTLVAWVAAVDQVVPIGEVVGRMSSASVPATAGVAPSQSRPEPAPSSPPPSQFERRTDVPPRTRAYAREKGLSDEQIEAVVAAGPKLMPTDIDSFLAKPKASAGRSYADAPMGGKQRILSSRMVRGHQLVVPGMMAVSVNWEPVEALRAATKAAGGDFQPSVFTYFAYAVAKAAAKHPVVRSSLLGESTVRTYDHVHLGIAVARGDGELVVAVVDDSDTLDWPTFAAKARESISAARDGRDQAHEAVTLSLTNMSGHGVRDAMAVVVPPGIVTVFLGEAHWGFSDDTTVATPQRRANVGVTIDHRLVNGVPGAEFLAEIKRNMERIGEVVGA